MLVDERFQPLPELAAGASFITETFLRKGLETDRSR
jgi:hypothetical protein